MKKLLSFFSPLLILAVFSACNSEPKPLDKENLYATSQTEPSQGDWVITMIPGEPDNLLPYVYRTGPASMVVGQIFQPLFSLDKKTYEIIPILATGLPEVSPDFLQYTYTIRPEAEWAPGKPITGKDVEFSAKVMYNPLVKSGPSRSFYSFIEDVITYTEDPKKVTFVISEAFYDADFSLGDMNILPMHFYDANNLMAKFSVKELVSQGAKLETNADIKAFADDYMSEKRQREKDFIMGSGAYKLEEWTTGQNIKLVRKENWWGDKLNGKLQAWPKQLHFKIVQDPKTQMTAMKNQEADVMVRIPAEDFIELKNNPDVLKHFNFYTPNAYLFSFLGLNMKPGPKRTTIFQDKSVRKAIALLLDCDKIIKELSHGTAERMATPVIPEQKKFLNADLKPIAHDVEGAVKLLEENGWTEKDNDGIRFKMLNGKKVRLDFEVAVSNKGDLSRNIILILQESALKAGVKVNINSFDFNVLIEKYGSHDFDAYLGFSGGSPHSPDFRQMWHTASWKNGSNYGGYSNPECDKIIDALRSERDETKRIGMMKEVQKLIYEDQPVVFIYSSLERMMVHKRFQNVEVTSLRPGFRAEEFWTPKEHVKFK